MSAARPRTLPAAIAPVVVGAGAGAAVLSDVGLPWTASSWLKAALAMVVALALQVGVNYANDYSDGIRGTDDEHRIGPFRLVGSKAAPPRSVKLAAFACFGVAAVAGLVLAILTAWWLILAGVACIAAAWFYTGGKHPYGYAGLGELFVFVFFGLVAVTGTTFVLAERVSAVAVILAVGTGLLTCAILVANNLRDVDTDAQTGKRTLAVLLGEGNTRTLFAVLVVGAFIAATVAAFFEPECLLALAALIPAIKPIGTVLKGAQGAALIPVLGAIGATEFAYGMLLLAGLLLGR
jgi:1,4-dihydroxy-2-naphthoate octaprenyltransferase